MKITQFLMLTPVFNLAQSLTDNLFRKTDNPIRGSIVYCDLAFGYAEHSGIYIGNNQIIHRNGKGIIEVTSPREFIRDTSALTIYVSCNGNGQAVGEEDVACLAEACIGHESEYELLGDNCHQFCSYCLTGDFYSKTSLLTFLKSEAKLYLGAMQWRAWDLLNR